MATVTIVPDLLLSTALGNDTGAPNSTSLPEGAGGVPPAVSFRAWLMPVIFGIIMLIGIVGNALVIFVIFRAGQRTVTNYYIVNLAVTDILFLSFCAPPTAAEYSPDGYLFGGFMCKFVQYLRLVTAQATCFFLMAMSLDRFQAIVRPLKSLKTRTLQTAVVSSVVIWLVALLLYIPLLIYFDLEYIDYYGVKPFCLERWPSPTWIRAFIAVSFVTVYALPLAVIFVCYGVMIRHLWQRVVPSDSLSGPANAANAERNLKQKRKITWMVLTVVIVFTVCWFPNRFYNMWQTFDPKFPYTDETLHLKMAGEVLSFLNSCANPFIYGFLGENFRKSFRKALPCCFRKAGLKREDTGRTGATGSLQGSTAGPSVRAGGTTHITQMSTFNSSAEVK